MSGNPLLDDLHGDIIYPEKFDERFDELQARHGIPGTDPCTTCDQDEHEALEEIARFSNEVKAMINAKAWTESSGMVSEMYFEKYVEDDVKGMHGYATIEALNAYLNWDAIEDDYTERFEMIEFDGVNYFADKE